MYLKSCFPSTVLNVIHKWLTPVLKYVRSFSFLPPRALCIIFSWELIPIFVNWVRLTRTWLYLQVIYRFVCWSRYTLRSCLCWFTLIYTVPQSQLQTCYLLCCRFMLLLCWPMVIVTTKWFCSIVRYSNLIGTKFDVWFHHLARLSVHFRESFDTRLCSTLNDTSF